ncbi:hypothetical protein CBS9595_003818 [Malassezia furfur]|nr:hypothetical protein CBS9595_003818 [Malassezia furfur]
MAPKVYYSPLMRVPAESDADAQTNIANLGQPLPTPQSVKDVSPNVCLSLVEFKGTSAPPSLLQHHDGRFSSATASDLGKSTYASDSESVCAGFWRELVDVWMRREDTIRYCVAVNQATLTSAPSSSSNPDDRLDLDRASAPAPVQSLSRAESQAEFTERQLRNELAIESIIRRRSLEVFKSRCRAFSPNLSDSVEGQRERTYWEGK